jgi:FtsP/CotA-like multicopper oxidase with cupredoxin domain
VAGPSPEPIARLPLNASVVFDVENRTAFEQALHVHGHVWQMASLGGQGLADEPWRDTAVIPSGKPAELVMIADNPGSWAIQSLVAERSDAGLIGAFTVA